MHNIYMSIAAHKVFRSSRSTIAAATASSLPVDSGSAVFSEHLQIEVSTPCLLQMLASSGTTEDHVMQGV